MTSGSPDETRQNADPTSSWGGLLRQRRRALGLTQQDVADLAGVGLRLVHEAERGSATIQLDNVIKLLRAVGLHLEVAPGAADHVSPSPRVTSGRAS